MIVLVDTSVWSLAFRRSQAQEVPEAAELATLIRHGKAGLIGPVRQEILAGIKSTDRFELLRERLRAFPDIPMNTGDFELAAEFFNACRAKGIQGSNTDFLISAAAVRRRFSIFTTDQDFSRFARVLPIHLHSAGSL